MGGERHRRHRPDELRDLREPGRVGRHQRERRAARLLDANGDIKGWNDLGSPADRSSYAANASQGMSAYISDENLESTYRSRFEAMFENPGGK